MEPNKNLRLLFITVSLLVSINVARSRLSPDVSPSPQPESSQGLAPSPESLDYVPFYESSSISTPPTESIAPNAADSLLTLPSEPYETGPLELSFSVKLHSVGTEPELKKICDSTDHPILCLSTIGPLVKGKVTVDSALDIAVRASNEFAKQGLAVVKQLAKKAGTPADVLSTLKDCKDSYETAVDNFEKTLEAFAAHDIGTMRSMLSAVITFVGDCEDEFAQMQSSSPLSTYAQKLTEMTSNCLAITSLTH